MRSEADSIRQGRLPQEQCIEPAVNAVWKHGARKHNDERSLQSTSAYAHDLPPSTDTTGRQNHMTPERKTNVNGWIRVCSTSFNFTEPNLCDTSAPSVQTDTWVPLHTFVVVGPQQKHFQAVATETERVKRST